MTAGVRFASVVYSPGTRLASQSVGRTQSQHGRSAASKSQNKSLNALHKIFEHHSQSEYRRNAIKKLKPG